MTAGPHGWNTLQKLRGSLYLIWALDALLLIAVLIGAQVHRSAMKGVGKDSAPSIIAAQSIKTSMADMDASAANELITPPGNLRDNAFTEYEQQRRMASTALIKAAKNITYGDSEQKPIEALQIGLGTFERLVQRARDLHERADGGFVDAYREAASLMDETLLPEADKLDKANLDQLEAIYEAQKTRSTGTVLMIQVVAMALLAALIGIQMFLTRRTHRILNPFLLAATLVALVYVAYSLNAMSTERKQLKVAKEDAFTSIHALWQARAVAYAANSDESRYLLDAGHANEHEAAFFDKADKLAKKSDSSGRLISGYLADELNNVTFEGEKEAALKTVATLSEYLRIDREIRRLEQGGKKAEALALCLGTRPGESNWAFDQFDRAAGKTLEINQNAFDNAVQSGLSALSGLELKAAITAAVIALLVFFGLLRRIQEYT